MCELENGLGQIPDKDLSLNQIDQALGLVGARRIFDYRFAFEVPFTQEQQAQVDATLKTGYYRRHLGHFSGEVQIRKDFPGVIEVDGDLRPYDFRCGVGQRLYNPVFCIEDQTPMQHQQVLDLANRIDKAVEDIANKK